MNGKYIGHFDVQRRLRFGVEVVELVDVIMLLGGWNRNDYFSKLAFLPICICNKRLTMTPNLTKPIH
jgi:hypothetical protein